MNSSEDPGSRKPRKRSIAKQFFPGYDWEFRDVRRTVKRGEQKGKEGEHGEE